MRVQADSKSSAPLPTLSIGEVAARTGLATSAIRYYEERGLVTPVARESGRRRFAPSAVKRLWLIELCTRAEFSLEETRLLLADRGRHRRASRALAKAKLGAIDDKIAELELAKQLIAVGMRCTCPSLEECNCAANFLDELTALRPG